MNPGIFSGVVRGGAKGTTTAADVTSSASGNNHQPLDVLIYDASGNPITSFGASTADGSTFTQNSTSGGIIMGVYLSAAQTLTSGKAAAAALDVNRNILISEATLIAGENLTTNRMNVEPIYSFSNITTATTTTVKSGAGTLHAITINAAGASGTITIYDNTAGSGTKIGTVTMPATLLANQFVLLYDISFSTGLTLVTATTAQDITVSFR